MLRPIALISVTLAVCYAHHSEHHHGGMEHHSGGMQHHSGGMHHHSGGMQHHSGGMQHHSGGMQHHSGGMQHHSGGMQHHQHHPRGIRSLKSVLGHQDKGLFKRSLDQRKPLAKRSDREYRVHEQKKVFH